MNDQLQRQSHHPMIMMIFYLQYLNILLASRNYKGTNCKLLFHLAFLQKTEKIRFFQIKSVSVSVFTKKQNSVRFFGLPNSSTVFIASDDVSAASMLLLTPL